VNGLHQHSLDEVLQVALQLEAWTRDARQCSDKAYRKPKVRAAVNDDSVNSSKRFDHLEADFNRRFDQLMKLHKASVVNPQATATKVPVASLIEFDDATQNSKDAKFQPNSRQHETQLNEPKTACHIKSKVSVAQLRFVGGVVNQVTCSVTVGFWLQTWIRSCLGLSTEAPVA